MVNKKIRLIFFEILGEYTKGISKWKGLKQSIIHDVVYKNVNDIKIIVQDFIIYH